MIWVSCMKCSFTNQQTFLLLQEVQLISERYYLMYKVILQHRRKNILFTWTIVLKDLALIFSELQVKDFEETIKDFFIVSSKSNGPSKNTQDFSNQKSRGIFEWTCIQGIVSTLQ